MGLLKIFIFLETITLIFIAMKKNPDVFSPVKFYLLFSIFFYLNIYFIDVKLETLACYFVLIQAIAICALLEKKLPHKINFNHDSILSYEAILWVLTLPPLIIMYYYIDNAGGVLEYLGVLALRVEAWSGQGPLTMVINWMPTINLVYFGCFLLDKDKGFFKKVRYFLHFGLFVAIGLLTGSRSYVGISILGMVVVWSYIKGVPKIRNIVVVAFVLIVFAGYMGAVRNTYGGGMTFDSLVNSLTASNFENAQMSYGVDPLGVIFSTPEKPPLLGATYLTLVTNLIPRYYWPDKPDTGGLIFTKEYTDDQSGLSFYATGAITEAIMNFGEIAGLIFGVFQILFLFLLGSLAYNKYFCSNFKSGYSLSVLFVIGFYYLILSFSKISYGEFTDVFQALLVFNLLPLILIGFSFRLKGVSGIKIKRK
jgi:hypothetical protein